MRQAGGVHAEDHNAWPVEADMTSPSASGPVRRLLWRAFGLTLAALLAGLIAPTTASAHGEGDSDESLVLVRQAIAYLVNKPGDTMDVEDKINDALEAPHTEGVNLILVKQAMDALDAGDMMQVRQLLEKSIGARPYVGSEDPVQIGKVPPPLTGADTGTLAALDPMPGRHGLTGGDWAAIVAAVLIALVGVALSFRLRPKVAHPQPSQNTTPPAGTSQGGTS
jgi:hypothetical protein